MCPGMSVGVSVCPRVFVCVRARARECVRVCTHIFACVRMCDFFHILLLSRCANFVPFHNILAFHNYDFPN